MPIPKLQEWQSDPEFQALPDMEKRSIFESYFDRELANEEFFSLPEKEQSGIKRDFLSDHGIEDKPELTWERAGGAIKEGVKDVARTSLKALQGIGEQGIPEAVKQGVEAVFPLAAGLRLIPEETKQRATEAIGEAAGAPELAPSPEFEGKSSGWMEDFVRSAPQMGTQIMATLAGGPLAGMSLMGLQITGGTYENAVKQGKDPGNALAWGVANAIVQAPLEQIGVSKISKLWRPQQSVIAKLKDIGEAVGTEWLTEFLQSYPDSISNIFAMNPDKGTIQKLNTFADQFMETTKQGAYEGTLTAPWALLGAAGMRRGNVPHETPQQPPPANIDWDAAVVKARELHTSGQMSADQIEALKKQAPGDYAIELDAILNDAIIDRLADPNADVEAIIKEETPIELVDQWTRSMGEAEDVEGPTQEALKVEPSVEVEPTETPQMGGETKAPIPETIPPKAETLLSEGETKLPKEEPTSFRKFFGKIASRVSSEIKGQNILDDMDAEGITPQQVNAKFWSSTYDKLDAQQKKIIERQIQGAFGLKPGDVIAIGKDGESIVAKKWSDITDDLPQEVSHLEGVERGMISLMKVANDMYSGEAAGPSPSPIVTTLKPETKQVEQRPQPQREEITIDDIGKMRAAYRDQTTNKVFVSEGPGEGHNRFAERLGLNDLELKRNPQEKKAEQGPWTISGYDYGLMDERGRFFTIPELDKVLSNQDIKAQKKVEPGPAREVERGKITKLAREAPTFRQWLRQNGGINPDDPTLKGELRDARWTTNAKGKKIPAKGFGYGLLNRKARSSDDITLQAIEAGWLPEGSDENDLMKAIIGNPSVTEKWTNTGNDIDKMANEEYEKIYADEFGENWRDEKFRQAREEDSRRAKTILKREAPNEVATEESATEEEWGSLLKDADEIVELLPSIGEQQSLFGQKQQPAFELKPTEPTPEEKIAIARQKGEVAAKPEAKRAVIPTEKIKAPTTGKQASLLPPKKGETVDMFGKVEPERLMTVTENEYKDPQRLIEKRIERKYSRILALPEEDFEGTIYEAINARRLDPNQLDKFLTKAQGKDKEEKIRRVNITIADQIGDLIATHKYDGHEAGQALEGYLDELLAVVKKHEGGKAVSTTEVRDLRAKGETQQPTKRRIPTSPRAGVTQALPLETLSTHIDHIVKNWKGAPTVNVVEDYGHLPASVKKAFREKFQDTDAQGMRGIFVGYSDETKPSVFLIGDKMASLNEAERTLLHEVIGHYGIRQALGKSPALDRFLNNLYFARSKQIKQMIEDKPAYRVYDLKTSEGQKRAADEWFAREVAEKGIDADPWIKRQWDRFVQILNDTLRAMGFKVRLSDSEIRQVLRASVRAVEEGPAKGLTVSSVSAMAEGMAKEPGKADITPQKPGKAVGEITIFSKSIDDYRKDPQLLVDELVDIVGEDYNGAISLRGIYQNELGKKKLKSSNEWVDGSRTNRKLGGTSGIHISGDWNYDPSSVIKHNIQKYGQRAKDYGDTDYIAVIKGDNLTGETLSDIGESVLGDAQIIAYIKKSPSPAGPREGGPEIAPMIEPVGKKGEGPDLLSAIKSLQTRGPRELVSISELRDKANLPAEDFDRQLIALTQSNEVALHQHDAPFHLSEEKRAKLLSIPDPTSIHKGRSYFVGVVPISKKPEIAASIEPSGTKLEFLREEGGEKLYRAVSGPFKGGIFTEEMARDEGFNIPGAKKAKSPTPVKVGDFVSFTLPDGRTGKGKIRDIDKGAGKAWIFPQDRSLAESPEIATVTIPLGNITKEEKPDIAASISPADVNTPEFKAWFKGSKVVDENGKPLVVYHVGQNRRRDFPGVTFWGSDAGLVSTFGTGFRAERASTTPAYLKIENPYYANWEEIEHINQNRREIDRIIKAGHDGIIEKSEDQESWQFVSFSPTQIKSIFNRGTWSPEIADISASIQSPDEWAKQFVSQFEKEPETKAEEKFDEEHHEDTVETFGKLRGFLKARKEGWKPQREDTHWLDKIYSVPLHHFKKVLALGRLFQDGLNRMDNYYSYLNLLTQGPDQKYHTVTIDNFRKQDKEGFKKFQKYLVDRDRNQVGFNVTQTKDDQYEVSRGNVKYGTFKTEEEAWEKAIQKEVAKYREAHGDQAADALLAFRRVTHNGFRILMKNMRDIIEKFENAGIPLPQVAIKVEGGKTSKVDLKMALAKMGDMRGYYFPRIRRSGQYMLIAKKGDTNPIMEFFDTKTFLTKKQTELQNQGYTVMKDLSPKMPEDVFQMAGEVIAMQATINQALEKIHTQGITLEDFGLEVVDRRVLTGKTRDFVVRGPTSKKMNEVFKDFGGRWYPAYAGEDRMWHFVNPGQNFEKRLSKALATQVGLIDQETDVLFAKTLAEQVANVIKARGHRAYMIERADAKGKDVWVGYEEDPALAIAQYARGIAAGEAKKNMALDMVRHFTGTDISWSDYKADMADQGKEPDYEEYAKTVNERRIHPTKQPNAFKEGKVFMEDMLRNQEHIDRVMGVIKGISVMKYLAGRVAAPVVNLTALATSAPAAISGYTKTSIPSAMVNIGKAGKLYTQYLMEKKWGKGLISKEHKVLFEEIENKGWHKAQYNREALSVLESRVGRQWSNLIEYSMAMFGATEQLNRMSTIVGAYLAIKESTPSGKFVHEQAIEKAKDISDKAHGVYSKANIPHWARGPGLGPQIAKSFYIFKTFSHNYVLTMKDLGFNEKEAGAALYMAVSPMILAGSGALVGKQIITSILEALGIGGDDPEEALYQWVYDNAGERGERLVRHGIFGVPGVNLKGSLEIGITDIPTTIKDALGAPGSMFEDLYYGGKSIMRGDIMKGTEKLLPNALAAPVRAVREATEGVTTGTNAPVFYGKKPLVSDTVEAIYRGLSFNPSRIAGIREKQWKEKKLEEKYSQMRTDIYAKAKRYYLKPSASRSQAEWIDILNEVKEYNERVMGNKLNKKGIPIVTSQMLQTNIKRAFKPSKKERMRSVEDETEE